MTEDMYRHDLETLDPEERRKLQSTRLSQLVERLRGVDSRYWEEKLGSHPGVSSIDELDSLPFTEKPELRDTYPHGMLAIPMRDVVRIHASSGTSGKPTIVAYSADDTSVFAEVVARSLSVTGATSEDVVQVAYGYGLSPAGSGSITASRNWGPLQCRHLGATRRFRSNSWLTAASPAWRPLPHSR